ncbi:MAG TPA: heparin lyase I family protein, partial [Solirubrobacterales bacterium]|nr:heparin lyase I family protein [Solirubrobacterales bacterium]
MNPRFEQDQSILQRRIARRRFVALATLAALAVLLLSTSVVSRATSLGGSVATAVLRGADIVSDGPALADNHVAHKRRPASLNHSRAVTHAPENASFPSAPAPGQAPVAAEPIGIGSEPVALAPTTSGPVGSEVPSAGSPPPAAEEPPAEESGPPPKSEPPPPNEPDPEPPHSGPEPPHSDPPPKSDPEPEPPKVEPSEPVEEPAEEEPASEQPPATPAEAPFFEGSEIDDFELIQAAPRAITEVPDPLGSGETVLKMTVDENDVAPVTPTDNPRAQALSPDVIENGDEFWLKTKFLIPQNFPSVKSWMSLVSIYGPPFNASSPWQIEVVADRLQWTRNRTYGFDVPWEAPLRKGVWITVLTHERFATDGWIEMWIDGQPVTFFPGSTYNPSHQAATTKLEMQTMDSSNNGGPNSAKIMQYRQKDQFDIGTLYFGAL